MKVVYIVVLTILNYSNCLGQDYFYKRINFDIEHNTPNQIFCVENRFFSTVGHFCGNFECCSLIELTELGDTLWRTYMPDIDPAFESMVISNDTITVTGNNDPSNTHFRMAHFSLDGEKLGETMDILSTKKTYTNSFQLSTQKLNGRFHIMGNGVANDSMFSLMYVVTPSGGLDTLIEMAKESGRCVPWDSDIDQDGNLITFHKLEESFGTRDYLQVLKYNEKLDTIFSYISEDNFRHLNGLRGASFEDKVIFSTYTPGANHVKHSLRVVDDQLNEDIIFEPEKISSNMRAFSRVKVLSNGDILGMGSFQDLSLDPPVDTAPWLIRMDQEGKVMWQRVFYELDPTDNEARFGVIRDVIELPNGDLYGVGDMDYEITSSVFFKIDSNGCLSGNDCGIINFITDTEDIDYSTDIIMYPNPVVDVLKVELPINLESSSIMIINEIGQKVISPFEYEYDQHIDVSNLKVGLYYLVIIKDGQIMGTKKISKVN